MPALPGSLRAVFEPVGIPAKALAVAFVIGVFPLLGFAGSGLASGPAIGVASSLEKLRPDSRFPEGDRIALLAARGECESAQIAVRAASNSVSLSAAAEPLSGPRALTVTLYREVFLDLPRGSGPDGDPGAWPDPLIPVLDPFFGEARRAFPVEVRGGGLGAIWVEVCVPEDAPPGQYRGEVALRDGEALLGRVPVLLKVWPFALPKTPTFVAAFGLSTRLATRVLKTPDDPGVASSLAAVALRHRISPYVLSADPPWGDCTAKRCSLDWTPIDAELAPILDGTLVPGERGGFAEVRIPARVYNGPDRDLFATFVAWQRHFESRGWADRLWLYTMDEPRADQLPELLRRAKLAKEAGLKVFVTSPPQAFLRGYVDAFAPQERLLREPKDASVLFTYTSCYSHGCDEMPDSGKVRSAMEEEFRGWPGYLIDRPGTSARAVAVLAMRRGLMGTLYYDMIHAWTGDPWRDPRAFAGNGDGTLLYPGRPEVLGGSHPFPVESIRLKIIRDSLEDVELFRLLSAAGLKGLVDSALARLVPDARSWERRPEPWLKTREELGEALAATMKKRP